MKLKLYDMDKVTDLKDMLQNSLEKYSDRTLFLVKDSHNQPYRPITYKQYGSDVHALGTALVARGYKDKRIAVLFRLNNNLEGESERFCDEVRAETVGNVLPKLVYVTGRGSEKNEKRKK